MTSLVRDSKWVQHSFLLAGKRMAENAVLRRYRYSSSADFKFTGSGFGMNTVINPAPQFTPFADPRRKGLWTSTDIPITSKGAKSSYFQGQGVAYSEMIDDNKQIVYIRPGVTQYKGMATFFTGFYDNNSALLARQGRASLAYYFGLGAATIGTLLLQPFILGFKVLGFLMGRTSSSYMSLKPTMPLYLERLTVIGNTLGANLGVITRMFDNTGLFNGAAEAFGTNANGGGAEYRNELEFLSDGSQSLKSALKTLMPDIVMGDGTINYFAALTQAARRQREWETRINKISGGFPNSAEGLNMLMAYLEKPLNNTRATVSLVDYLNIYHKGVIGSIADRILDGDGIGDTLEATSRSGDSTTLSQIQQAAGGTAADTGATDNGGNTSAAAANSLVDSSNTSSLVANVNPQQSALNPNQTGVPMIFKDSPEKLAQYNGTAYQQAVSGANSGEGINADNLRSTVFAKRESEMTTVVRGKDNAPTDTVATQALASDQAGTTNTGAEKSFYEIVVGWISRATETLGVGWDNGLEFISFAVNYTGSGSMSMSNTTKETTISGTLKGVSGTSRDSRISLSDFKTGFAFIDGVTNMVRDVFAGAMDAVSMGGLMALAGNAFIDFPKQWDDSSATVPTANFTIELRSPYGNVLASYLNLYTTVAAILALGTPLSTGPQSYTAPFALEAYCQGSFAIRYGMVSSVSIRHGTGNLGFTSDKRRPLAFDIDVEIVDFSSVYHFSVTNGMSPLNIFKRVVDDDNLFTDYMCTISGMSLVDMTNTYRKLSIRMAAQWSNVKSFWTPEHLVSKFVYGSDTVQTVKKLFGPASISGQ